MQKILLIIMIVLSAAIQSSEYMPSRGERLLSSKVLPNGAQLILTTAPGLAGVSGRTDLITGRYYQPGVDGFRFFLRWRSGKTHAAVFDIEVKDLLDKATRQAAVELWGTDFTG